MESIDSIVAELKALPPAQLERAALYIHQLSENSQADRIAAFRNTAGALTAAEADEWLQAIEDCERIDESAW
jgi:hypothetical protein